MAESPEEKILAQKVDGVVVTVPAEGLSFYIYKRPGIVPGVEFTEIEHLRPKKEFFESLVEAVKEAIKKKPEIAKEVI
jgi:hypothetical protein